METTFIRDGNKLIDLREDKDSPNRVEVLKSVSKAKRKSRELQQANGGMGRGYVKCA